MFEVFFFPQLSFPFKLSVLRVVFGKLWRLLFRSQQEIEEDKKKAEQEGIAVTTPRKPRHQEPETDRRKSEKENFAATVDVCKPAVVRPEHESSAASPPRARS